VSTHSIHQFSEKVAVITDVADAIGRAAAVQLALNGAFVIGGEPESEDPSGIVEELRSLGTLAGAIQCDTGTASGAAALAGEADRMFGRLDLLVNCLKTTPKSTFPETREGDLNAEVGRTGGCVGCASCTASDVRPAEAEDH
jgi:NAD(P)-dependent dehydrogenase (short-subunit alcohol dehydrogenase family)